MTITDMETTHPLIGQSIFHKGNEYKIAATSFTEEARYIYGNHAGRVGPEVTLFLIKVTKLDPIKLIKPKKKRK